MNDISIDIINAVKEIKSAIVRAQARVSANANAEMLSLYFGIGRYVSYKTQTEKWGTGIIDTISAQLQKEMPGLRGFSGKSIRKMRQFYEAWSDSAIWPSATANLLGVEVRAPTRFVWYSSTGVEYFGETATEAPNRDDPGELISFMPNRSNYIFIR